MMRGRIKGKRRPSRHERNKRGIVNMSDSSKEKKRQKAEVVEEEFREKKRGDRPRNAREKVVEKER